MEQERLRSLEKYYKISVRMGERKRAESVITKHVVQILLFHKKWVIRITIYQDYQAKNDRFYYGITMDENENHIGKWNQCA